VLGSGLDAVSPPSNRSLARRIVESGGALVSEYPPGTPPLKHHFPARNRIIAGLCRALVVVEAPSRSGALISADFALDQGRDLWVVSACLGSHAGEGCRNLARDGARVARSACDIVSDWGMPVPDVCPQPAAEASGATPFGIRAARSLEFELHFEADSKTSNRPVLGVR
jgi:DNA processing protein